MSNNCLGINSLFRLLFFIFVFGNSLAFAQNVKTFVPEKAKQYLPIVKDEQRKYFPDIEVPEYFGGLVEQESCISLKHSRCWDPRVELKTSREYGVGVGQLTKAFKADGSIRFDALTEMKKQHRDLAELDWSTIKSRPDLQVRTMILMVRNSYKSLYSVNNAIERLKFSDAAYNGGLGGLQKERRYCGLKTNCDPNRWFGHVENTCLKSKKPIYGTSTPCSINRTHVSNIFNLRMAKYKPYF